MTQHDDLVQSQIEYYRARAPEYDEWFQRQGRYDRGPEFKARWDEDVDEVRDALSKQGPRGQVVEFACGTGLWTERLIQQTDHVTALDISSESLEFNRVRVGTNKVTHVCTDLFDWKPPHAFDGAFFGFWLSHVPPDRFEQFWERVGGALKKDGRVFFVDSRYAPRSTAKDHGLEGPESVAVTRRLNDGRAFRIVKIFYEPGELRARLAKLGWSVEVHETREFFIYGFGQPS